jgi:hypothetical protein
MVIDHPFDRLACGSASCMQNRSCQEYTTVRICAPVNGCLDMHVDFLKVVNAYLIYLY